MSDADCSRRSHVARSIAWSVQIKEEAERLKNGLEWESSVLITNNNKIGVHSTAPTQLVELPLQRDIYNNTPLTQLAERREEYLEARNVIPFAKNETENLRNVVRATYRTSCCDDTSISDAEVDKRMQASRIDWNRVSDGMLTCRLPSECRIRWQNVDNPRLNNQPLDDSDLKILLEIYENHKDNMEHDSLVAFWSAIAKDFSGEDTTRSAHFCMKEVGKYLSRDIIDNRKYSKNKNLKRKY
ncbi:hypothetical protein E3Q10_01600 [Wallemia mellicola]|uniref:Myb-like domain-containing protein n=2 Tax=Wallemia mellicola TaxID=1708541 RepID=A0A4T0NBA2_9BASI|nr:hypothetical protein E3Q19_01386 [Wallemia mellicola]TIC02582.1 hypothetical protein E3Q17_01356 [Wallemia mellicola]TIC28381.1 hypothetical protein E3Q11_01832 [Wallemia mellicola]TIC31418.1 hypothetical protein E3Q10_01600 [Wallemia mellicola]TIC74128.1 hypothetical protein E3Q00_02279 [Wallemia mellicola]